MRSKGLEVSRVNNKKPTETKPITPSTRATTTGGTSRLNQATAPDQTLRINTHNSNEPSWAPHTPEIL